MTTTREVTITLRGRPEDVATAAWTIEEALMRDGVCAEPPKSHAEVTLTVVDPLLRHIPKSEIRAIPGGQR